MENQANLSNAVLLYEVIGKYVPTPPDEDENYLDFIDKIIQNIRDSKDYQAYLDAIHIMTGATFNTLKEESSDDVLNLFISGLMEWRIIELVSFFRELGYQHA